MNKSDQEFAKTERDNKVKDALINYLEQFTSKKEILIEMHHLNTYQYHLNVKLWHLEEEAVHAEEEHSANELEKTQEKETRDSTLSVVED